MLNRLWESSHIFFMLLFVFQVNAQIIKGTISDASGIVPFVNISIKDANNFTLQFTATNEIGNFHITLKNSTEAFFLEASSLRHETVVMQLADLKLINNEIFINILLEQRTTSLKEVVITKTLPIIHKKDTLVFNANSFKDGSEKNVEDLLRKLPGIKIESNGTIKYKGKNIKKMLLDGDDLFDANYTIGSKNISADMIEKVQGIDNYEENELLKDLKVSDDVALNLIFKKNVTDFTGNATLGYGIENRYYGSAAGIFLNKKVKSFNLVSYANVGQNKSPYDHSSGLMLIDNAQNKNLLAKTLINEGNFVSLLDNELHHDNNNFYTSSNSIFKMFKKSNLKLNSGLYNDMLNRLNENNSLFFIDNNVINIQESNNLKKRINLFDLQLFFSNKERKIFHWEYFGKLDQSDTDINDLSSNNGLVQNNKIKSHRFNSFQSLNATLKMSDNKAIVTSAIFSESHSPQQMTLNPGTAIDDLNQLLAVNQQSRYRKQFLAINSSMYGGKKKLKYQINSSYFIHSNFLISNLLNQQNQIVSNAFTNNNEYQIKNFNINPILVYNSEKYSARIGVNAVYNGIEFNDVAFTNQNNAFFIVPQILLIYKFNPNRNLKFNYSFNQVLPSESQNFAGIVQTNYREFTSNEFSLRYLKTFVYQLSYNFNDRLQLIKFSVVLNHEYRPNNYFSKTVINQNISSDRLFYADLGNRATSISLDAEKYFHPLRTTLNFDATFNLSSNNNILNGVDFRDITNQSINFNLTARRSFNKTLLLENKLYYMHLNSIVRAENLKNDFQMLNNNTKLIFKYKESISSILNCNFIMPNLKTNQKYFFIDYEFNYKVKNKNTTYSIIAKNLANNKVFSTINVTDFSRSISSHNLIARYIMLKCAFTF